MPFMPIAKRVVTARSAVIVDRAATARAPNARNIAVLVRPAANLSLRRPAGPRQWAKAKHGGPMEVSADLPMFSAMRVRAMGVRAALAPRANVRPASVNLVNAPPLPGQKAAAKVGQPEMPAHRGAAGLMATAGSVRGNAHRPILGC